MEELSCIESSSVLSWVLGSDGEERGWPSARWDTTAISIASLNTAWQYQGGRRMEGRCTCIDFKGILVIMNVLLYKQIFFSNIYSVRFVGDFCSMKDLYDHKSELKKKDQFCSLINLQ